MKPIWSVGALAEPISGRRWSPDETHLQIQLRVGRFVASGIQSGDRVLIHFGNRLEFFAELLAVWNCGACAIPVDARLTPFEVGKLATTARARFSIIDDDTDPATVEAAHGNIVRHTSDLTAMATDAGSPGIFPRLDDDALILFTSGSTGRPKGVVHTHRSLLARWTTLQQSLGLARYRRTLCILPTHFGHGLICNCLYPWLAGCDLHIAPPFKTDLLLRLGSLIDEHDISFMSSVPSVWSLVLKAASPPQRRSLVRIHVGSAPLSESMWKKIQGWTGTDEVLNAYGITETGSWVAGTTGGKVIPESGLIGEPWGARIRIMAGGHECGAGETGMVGLQTPALMKGYFERQDLTDEAVRNGWFMTGDIGLVDDRGRLFLKGRERDEINKGGIKIFPADIDEVVEQFQATQDVCTFGFEDEFYGENVGLAVVLSDRSEAAMIDLYHWVRQHLAEHKHPVRWYLLDEIPRTSRGKVNRASVKDHCLSLTPLDLRQFVP
jgi:acyl-CoA synthetase (AMP-forming)/AMP-acid ligase II